MPSGEGGNHPILLSGTLLSPRRIHDLQASDAWADLSDSTVYTLVGVLILGVLDNGMTQLRVDSYVREIFVGLIVLAAVAVASLSKRRNAK